MEQDEDFSCLQGYIGSHLALNLLKEKNSKP
jgi:hypothetical protein